MILPLYCTFKKWSANMNMWNPQLLLPGNCCGTWKENIIPLILTILSTQLLVHYYQAARNNPPSEMNRSVQFLIMSLRTLSTWFDRWLVMEVILCAAHRWSKKLYVLKYLKKPKNWKLRCHYNIYKANFSLPLYKVDSVFCGDNFYTC